MNFWKKLQHVSLLGLALLSVLVACLALVQCEGSKSRALEPVRVPRDFNF